MIGFDVCQEGNSFSLGLLRYLLISLLQPSGPVRISLFMSYGVTSLPFQPALIGGPHCVIYFRRVQRTVVVAVMSH